VKKKVFGLILIILHLLSLNKGNAKSHSSNLNSLRFENKLQKNSITISGIVKDKESGETLPFANVFVKDTNIGTTTNEDGFFTLFNVPSETSTLQVQYIGYKVEILVLNQEIVKNKIIILLIPDDNQLDEVVVSNDPGQQIVKMNKNVSQISLSPKKLASIPNLGEKDIFRAIQLIPGVSGTNESSSGLYVRGGTPDQNLVLLDGFTVYHVDHFYGFFSAFNSGAIKDIQLYKGGFPAEYGGRISSVMDLTGKTGNSNKFSLSAGLSLVSANATLEIPIGDKANLLIAGRRSYTDILKSGLYNIIFDLYNDSNQTNGNSLPNFNGFQQNQTQPTFYFYDLNTKFSYKPSDKDIISISIYNGEDNLDSSRENQNTFGSGTEERIINSDIEDLLNWGNWGSSFRWARQWSDKLYTNVVGAYSNYFSQRKRINDISIQLIDTTTTNKSGLIEDNNLNDYTLRIHNEYKINSKHSLEFGGQLTKNEVDYNYSLNDSISVINQKDKGLIKTLYIQNKWSPTEKLNIIGGIRTTHFDVTNELYYEPRLSGSYQLNNKVKLKGAWGKYYQFVNRIVREDVTQGSRDFWLLANKENSPISFSQHLILGTSYEVDDWLFDVEYFEKEMTGLTEFSLRFQSALGTDPNDQLFFEGTGISRGVDFLIQKKVGKYTGWLGYTLSEVVHTFPDLSNSPFYSLNDQRHEFKIVNVLKAGRWDLGATWVYGSGKPYTAPNGLYTITLLDGKETEYVSIGEKNGLRIDPYHRLDLSATYNFNLGSGKGEMGLSIFNLYNKTNTWYNEFEVVDNQVTETNVNYIGFTPSLFFNVSF
jgi:ferric enterobactin receptor